MAETQIFDLEQLHRDFLTEEILHQSSLSFKQIRMLIALKHSFGIVRPASKMAKIGRATHYHWLKTCEKYKESYGNILEFLGDLSEASLLNLIAMGNASSTIFYLSTKGRHRGYVIPKKHYKAYERLRNITNQYLKFKLLIKFNKNEQIHCLLPSFYPKAGKFWIRIGSSKNNGKAPPKNR